MRVLLFIVNTSIRFVWFTVAGPGNHLGVGLFGRLRLASQVLWTYARLQKSSASTPNEQLVLITAILSLPKELPGDIAEFGCFKGISSCALSLAARVTRRKLIIFDSFEGLPPPVEMVHNFTGPEVVYRKGDFAGSLDEVRGNIERFGAPEVVEYVKGYFSDTLPGRIDDKYALIFEDADLVESVRTVLKFGWARLSSGGFFFCHEARDFEVVQLFYDSALWAEMTSLHAPGLIGAGVGLPLDPMAWSDRQLRGGLSFKGSCLGYVTKKI